MHHSCALDTMLSYFKGTSSANDTMSFRLRVMGRLTCAEFVDVAPTLWLNTILFESTFTDKLLRSVSAEEKRTMWATFPGVPNCDNHANARDYIACLFRNLILAPPPGAPKYSVLTATVDSSGADGALPPIPFTLDDDSSPDAAAVETGTREATGPSRILKAQQLQAQLRFLMSSVITTSAITPHASLATEDFDRLSLFSAIGKTTHAKMAEIWREQKGNKEEEWRERVGFKRIAERIQRNLQLHSS